MAELGADQPDLSQERICSLVRLIYAGVLKRPPGEAATLLTGMLTGS